MPSSKTFFGTTFEERAQWLRYEVMEAEQIISLIKKGDAGWVSDPWVDGVYAVQYMGPEPMPNDKIILVVYEHGRDFEISSEGDDLLLKLRKQDALAQDEEDV